MFGIDCADVCYAFFCFGKRFGSALVSVVIGAHGVHTDAPDEGSLATLFADVCEEVGGWYVDCSVVGCGCGPVREGAGDEAVVDVCGAREVREG